MEKTLTSIKEDHNAAPLLEQYQEQMSDVKREQYTIYEELITIDLPDDHDLVIRHTAMEELHFSCPHGIKRRCVPGSSTPNSSTQ